VLQRGLGERHGAVAEAHARWCEVLVDADAADEAETRCAEAMQVARAAADADAQRHVVRARARLALRLGAEPEMEASAGASAPERAPDPFDALARLALAEALRDAGYADLARAEADAAARAFAELGPPWDALRRRALAGR
jgi:hypothetical protein